MPGSVKGLGTFAIGIVQTAAPFMSGLSLSTLSLLLSAANETVDSEVLRDF
jgi:hypothetical protein